ncbi:MAG: recombinase family protein [Clostridia bacterium]|nr:recombinase family protein [Clostridia bacterium]
MYRFYNYAELFKPYEIIDYLRKSQSDDPLLTVEEILAKHEAILDEWDIKHLGALVPEENRFREIVSGETIKERPEINKVLRLIESPKYKAVKIVEPQRLTRGDLEDIGRIMKLLKHTNTYIITADRFSERLYDLHEEDDWNAFEAELKKGNDYLNYYKKIQKRGRDISLSQGNYIASVPPYGYEKIKVKEGKKEYPTLKENPDEANVVRMIFDMYGNQGMGRMSICYRLDELGIKPPKGEQWSATTLKEMLKNIHYIGKVKGNWRPTITIVEDGKFKKTRPQGNAENRLVYEGKHNGIISPELFERVQNRIGNNPRTKPTTKLRNPFATLLYCRNCGKVMVLKYFRDKQGNEKCAPRFSCIDQARCGAGSCTYAEISDLVCQTLEHSIEDFEICIKNDESDSSKLHAQLIKTLEKKLKELEAKELTQWEQQAHPDPSQRMPAEIFKQLNKKLLKEKEDVKQALRKAYESQPAPIDYKEKIKTFKDAIITLKDPAAEAVLKNELLKACIERIDYYREKPQRVQSSNKKSNWNNPAIELDVKLKV